MKNSFIPGYASAFDMNKELNAQSFRTDRHIKQNVNTSIPARVIEVDRKTKRLTCTPMVHQITPDGRTFAHGKIFEVPYGYPQGGSCVIKIDPSPGDMGFISFAQRDITRIKRNLKEDAPETLRSHAWEDAVFVATLHSDKEAKHIIAFDEEGGITLTSPQPFKIKANVEIEGNVTVKGNVTASEDVKTGSISLKTHIHGGVRTGEGATGEPQ